MTRDQRHARFKLVTHLESSSSVGIMANSGAELPLMSFASICQNELPLKFPSVDEAGGRGGFVSKVRRS